MPELAMSPGLANKFSLFLYYLTNGLFVSHLWSTHIGTYVKLPEETVHDNLQVELPHPGNDRLPRFLVRTHPKGRILRC